MIIGKGICNLVLLLGGGRLSVTRARQLTKSVKSPPWAHPPLYGQAEWPKASGPCLCRLRLSHRKSWHSERISLLVRLARINGPCLGVAACAHSTPILVQGSNFPTQSTAPFIQRFYPLPTHRCEFICLRIFTATRPSPVSNDKVSNCPLLSPIHARDLTCPDITYCYHHPLSTDWLSSSMSPESLLYKWSTVSSASTGKYFTGRNI